MNIKSIPNNMKAVITNKYGNPEVLKFENVDTPVIKENEILIKMHACSIAIGDIRIRGAIFPEGMGFIAKLMFGFNGPKKKIQGVDFAGEIVAIGSLVKKFKVGDKVFGIDSNEMGAYAEYKKAKENAAIALIPEGFSFEKAAALAFGGATALGFLKHKVQIKKGDKILINGASGTVGSASVQIAKYFGAEVYAVCSGKNIDLVKSIGADFVIDYQKENIEKLEMKFDYIMDTVGNLNFKNFENKLNENGKFLAVAVNLGVMLKSIFNKKIIAGEAGERAEDMRLIKQLCESNNFKPVIDKIYDFEEIVEAHKHSQTGHKVGNVVLRVG